MTHLEFQLERLATPCGEMLVITDDAGNLRALDWHDFEERMNQLLRRHYGQDTVRLVAASRESNARRAIEAYLSGDLQAIDAIPVKTAGTPFQREVWTALRAVPAGTTVSYGALAKQLQRPNAVRAVGLANGANPIGVVVPCHRVIGANGSLTGYGGGLDRKRWLLEHEGLRFSAARQASFSTVERQ